MNVVDRFGLPARPWRRSDGKMRSAAAIRNHQAPSIAAERVQGIEGGGLPATAARC